MSEVDLASLAKSAEAEEKRTDSKKLTPMEEANEALKACEFGWFHIRLLITSFFGVSSAVLLSSSTAYIITNAECDLKMDLFQKGVLNAITYFGMFTSTVISGFLSDTFGRKLLLVAGFGSMTVFTLFTAVSQTFIWICTTKFLEGVSFAAAFNPLFAYTSECCHNGIRDRLMLYQASYMAVGQVWVALFSWAVLTQEWRVFFFDGAFVLNTWNFYLLFITIAPLTSTILYSFMPESPKYLVTQKRYKEAREALTTIYKENTRKQADTFPYKDIWKILEKEQTINEECTEANKSAWDDLKKQLVVGLHNCKPLFKKPLGPYMALFCTVNFLIMLMYNVFRLWFPQLSTIVEHFSEDPGYNSNLCSMLEGYVEHRNTNETVAQVCIPNKSGAETYINSVIVGLICLPPFLLSGIIVNKMGKKYLLIILSLISVALTLAIRFSSSKYEVVGLISLDIGSGQIMMSLMQVFTVERFPTSTRSLSVSLLMLAGRVGTLVGNMVFPLLLEQGCNTTFYTLTGNMICVTLLLFLLPKAKKK